MPLGGRLRIDKTRSAFCELPMRLDNQI